MRPVHITLQLIEALSAVQPAGVTELAALTGIPRSTAQRALMTLYEAGWIELVDAKRGNWTLSLRALIAAGRAGESQGTLRNIAIPVMEELRRSTEETIHLMARQAESVVLIERLDGIRPVEQFRPFGSSAPLNLVATGKAILAALPEDELDDYLREPLPARTPISVTDPEVLRRELVEVRARGYATTFGGNRPTVAAVGAAILDSNGKPFAALSASGPLARITPQRAEVLGPLVADAARRIGMGIGWQKGVGAPA